MLIAAITLASADAGAQARWTVDAKPMLDIKGVDDAGAVVFGSANWATRLDNGTIVVADPSGPAVHFLTASGKLMKSAGRAGQGPGDFRTVTWVGQCAKDTVFAWDFPQSRITTYDASGTLGRTYRFGVPGGPQTFTSCNRSGSLVQFGAFRRLPVESSPDQTQPMPVMQMAASPMVIGPRGDTTATLGEVLYVEMLGNLNGRGGGAVPRPLGGTTYAVVSGDRAFVVRSQATAITAYRLDGTAAGSIPLNVAPRNSTPGHYMKAADVMLAMVPAQVRATARTSLLEMAPPPQLPTVTGLLSDPGGLVWAVLSSPGDPDTRLRVFRSDGTVAANVTVPVNITVFEIGADYVLGNYTDDQDEPHLVMFRLRRTG